MRDLTSKHPTSYFLSSIILFVFSLLMQGCSPSLSKTFVSGNFVPDDLQSSGRILLVKANFDRQYDLKRLTRCMDKNYHGSYELVPAGSAIDHSFPDTSVYRYVMVIAGALYETDFNGISNKEQFFDSSGSFVRQGSSLYIFDRASNHPLYESGEAGMMSREYFVFSRIGEVGHMATDLGFQYKKFKKYLQYLNRTIKP